MLIKIGKFLGIITALSALSLLFLLAVYESPVLATTGFTIIAILFDAALFASHILILIDAIRQKNRKTVIAFALSLLTFITGSVVLLINQSEPRFLLCLYDAIMIIFYAIYFITDKKTARQ